MINPVCRDNVIVSYIGSYLYKMNQEKGLDSDVTSYFMM